MLRDFLDEIQLLEDVQFIIEQSLALNIKDDIATIKSSFAQGDKFYGIGFDENGAIKGVLNICDLLKEELRNDSINKETIFCSDFIIINKDQITTGMLRHIPNRYVVIMSGIICDGIIDFAYQDKVKFMTPFTDINFHFLESILENSYDGIYITNADGLTLLVNKSYERITGMNRDHYIGKNMTELMETGIMKTHITKDVVRLKHAITITEPLLNGKEVIITGNPIFNCEGDVTAVVTNVRDVTEILQLEKEQALSKESLNLYQKELFKDMPDDIICENEETRHVLNLAKKFAAKDSTVLILGETGVGKDVFARYIHTQSKRKDNNYIKVNCGSIPKTLLESELFGYVGGAFTGANIKGKMGLFELADGGTLFLDEIGELPFDTQASLLRVLQDHEIQRVGDSTSRKVNVRIIAATNRDLEKMIAEGSFRMDLYYRLNVVSLKVPPLRERKEDIPFLAEHYVSKLNEKYNENKVITKRFIDQLMSLAWPGNIRELNNFIERQFVMSDSNILEGFLKEENSTLQEPFCAELDHEANSIPNLNDAIEQLEAILIERAISEGGTSQKAASLLGISQPTFSRKYNKLFGNKIT